MKCVDCGACQKDWNESEPDKYYCLGVKEPFEIYDIYAECTEYPEPEVKTEGEEKLIQKHGHWYALTSCSNAGVYCSVCNKKVYKELYANVREKSKFCPNCGSIMDGEFVRL